MSSARAQSSSSVEEQLAAVQMSEVDPAGQEQYRMSDAAELERTVQLYLSGQYEECVSELGVLLDPESPAPFSEPRIIERGRLYYASCAVLAGQANHAKIVMRAALEENPLMPPPDSLTFPPPVISLFLEVREEIQALITQREQEQVARLLKENEEARRRAQARALREQELYELASEQPVVVRSSRWIASLPFGAGQYQNGSRDLGHVFLVSEVLLGATALISAGVLIDLHHQVVRASEEVGQPGFRAQYESAKSNLDGAYTLMTISSVSFAAVAALGIFEAHLNYQEERQVAQRKRVLPPHLRPEGSAPPVEEPRETSALPRPQQKKFSVLPQAGASPAGFQLGVIGVF